MNAITRLLGLASLGFAIGANAGTITFDEAGIVHGTIIDTQFQTPFGVTFSVTNTGGGPNLGVAFDSTATGTRDPDLEDAWSGGNLASNTILGNLLIIQENNNGTDDGVANDPDDEASRPAGTITIDFDFLIDSIGFDLIDIESATLEAGSVATFLNGGAALTTVDFADFLNLGAFDRNAVYGNNSANRIAPLTAAEMGIGSFDQVIISMGGSGAVDNITWSTVPEPATSALLAGGLLGLGWRRAYRPKR
jgi:hypothetical protein